MKKKLLFTALLFSCLQVCGQSWTKISNISDTVKVAAVAQIDNQVVISGQRWGGTIVNHFKSTDGNTWEKLPTFNFAGNYLFGLPQNSIILGGSFLSCKKLTGSSWTTDFAASGFAEFPDGTIIGGSSNYPDYFYQFSTAGVQGAQLGTSKFKFGAKYFIGTQNRLFLSSYGSGFAYIDQADKSIINFPASLDNVAMTESSWQLYNIGDMVKTSGGILIASEVLGYGIFRSTDNGVNWTTVVQESGASAQSMVINSQDEIFVIYGGKLRKSTDLGLTFPDFSTGLPDIQADLFLNANDELFVICNANGSVDPDVSGIYKIQDLSVGVDVINRNDNKLVIYPNPSKHSIVLDVLSTSDNKAYTISNTNGQVVQSGFVNNDNSIKLNDLKAGVYMLNVVIEGKSSRQKLIIE